MNMRLPWGKGAAAPAGVAPWAVGYYDSPRAMRARGSGRDADKGELMQLNSGIPTLIELDRLKNDDWYAQHVGFNQAFLDKHAAAMASYGRHWGLNPYKLWSRRWEYPYVAQRLIDYARALPAGPVKILDAGSGVTYFPYFVIDRVPSAEFICCDYDTTYAPMFDQINRDRGNPKVSFLQASLQKLPLPEAGLDAICCISVLEHTDNYGEIVNEFSRVLKPGGLFVLTFDLSLDGKFTLPKPLAQELLRKVGEKFDFAAGFDAQRELESMHNDGILSSDHVRRTEPELLPWSFPVRVYKAAADLFQGRGWTGGFRSRTVFCVEVRKKRM